VTNVRDMPDLIRGTLVAPQFRAALFGFFAVSALLAVVGLYGVRMALGDRRAVFSMVVSQGLRVILAGLVVGAGGAAGREVPLRPATLRAWRALA
jgi:hypothetical protein